MTRPRVSVVVIGRNEGVRLRRCLGSVQCANWTAITYELIYVDSRSTDDSAQTAQDLGAQVLVLDDPSPCAAKARNLGWRTAQGEFILFLDGDTLLHPEFVQRAMLTMSNPTLCAAWGHRRETHPQQSIYTRMLDLDWIYPVGQTLYFGGDVLVRRDALAQVDGFDPNLKAGEEPEMCSRLRATGWVIEHIDEPMTGHDLAIRTWKAYWLRAKRSGMAYAEIAHKMQKKGDLMWQNEAKRDLVHGSIYLASPLILAALYALSPLIPLIAAVLFFTLLIRTALRSAWKAPTNHMLCMQYAVHVHLQKIPSLFGQLAWRLNHRRGGATQWVDYKNHAPRPNRIKSGMVHAITGLAKLWRGLYIKKWLRVWSLARLQADIGKKVDPSNVLLGPIEIQGTARIYFGCGALIYPDCYLETQGSGSIEIGDNVVLSRGVHIVAFDKVVLSDGVMVGEYTSIRDANHRVGTPNTRSSGHDSAPIHISRNVWIGRGVCVLKGAHIGQNTVVAANATVTQSLPADVIATGTPARVKTDLKA